MPESSVCLGKFGLEGAYFGKVPLLWHLGKRPRMCLLDDCFKNWASCECTLKNNSSDKFCGIKYLFTAKDVRINSAS